MPSTETRGVIHNDLDKMLDRYQLADNVEGKDVNLSYGQSSSFRVVRPDGREEIYIMEINRYVTNPEHGSRSFAAHATHNRRIAGRHS